MDKLISVIIPCYNAGKTLSRTLTSLSEQDYKNLQIILVDDGSSDNSLEVAQQFAKNDSRIEIVRQSNQGVSVARNTGLSKANGDYILFMDSDDNYTTTHAISKMMNLLEKENADQVICNFTHPCFEQFTPSRTFDFSNTRDFMDFYQDHFLHGVPWNKITKKECLTEPFIPNIVFEDVIYNLANFGRLHKVVTTNEVLYNYYCAPKSDRPSIINSMYTTGLDTNPQTIWYKQKANKGIIDGYLNKYSRELQGYMRYTRYFDYLFFDLFFMYSINLNKDSIYSVCKKIFNDSLWIETLKDKENYGLKFKEFSDNDINRFIDLTRYSYNDIKDNKKEISTLLVGLMIFGNIFIEDYHNLNTIDILARSYKDYLDQSTNEARYTKEILENI